MSSFRIGIMGGMGPLAGVELHRLIIEATPAKVDQDHIQVVLFTNPKIPDRTRSLREDNGRTFAEALADTAQSLEAMRVDIMAIACMTAHSRLPLVQSRTSTPIINGIAITQQYLLRHHRQQTVALLATEGSIGSGVYTRSRKSINWLIPPPAIQAQVSQAIYTIKAGEIATGTKVLLQAMSELKQLGADVFVLGCTELGLLHRPLTDASYSVVDPMRLLAAELVRRALAHQSVTALA